MSVTRIPGFVQGVAARLGGRSVRASSSPVRIDLCNELPHPTTVVIEPRGMLEVLSPGATTTIFYDESGAAAHLQLDFGAEEVKVWQEGRGDLRFASE